eukprot:CAMPEP_0174347916 /NCGR_PEP_ID=MMETSP0811_2-20130205/4159_1 /TAXON_ID=73025 ORGANISM="Eutreptiella gymnastica-like, Strain CCMP1594" /NCGR_SAMPLE_ID=MMETSP0811_2 /ASSEMBLY_ACC=CAM_ASM_000667 /LENGTH=827 /DNA_ID=CAMNT_0015473939 /DNA_START=200 /DNA_END=2683 /DNA_ORIENTATION=-
MSAGKSKSTEKPQKSVKEEMLPSKEKEPPSGGPQPLQGSEPKPSPRVATSETASVDTPKHSEGADPVAPGNCKPVKSRIDVCASNSKSDTKSTTTATPEPIRNSDTEEKSSPTPKRKSSPGSKRKSPPPAQNLFPPPQPPSPPPKTPEESRSSRRSKRANGVRPGQRGWEDPGSDKSFHPSPSPPPTPPTHPPPTDGTSEPSNERPEVPPMKDPKPEQCPPAPMDVDVTGVNNSIGDHDHKLQNPQKPGMDRFFARYGRQRESCSIYDAETTVDRLYSSRTSHTAYGTKTAVDRVFSPPLLETKPLAGLDSAGSSPLDVSQLPSSDVAKDALEAGALWSPVMERGQTPEAEQTCPDNQPSAVSLEAETIDMDEFQDHNDEFEVDYIDDLSSLGGDSPPASPGRGVPPPLSLSPTTKAAQSALPSSSPAANASSPHGFSRDPYISASPPTAPAPASEASQVASAQPVALSPPCQPPPDRFPAKAIDLPPVAADLGEDAEGADNNLALFDILDQIESEQQWNMSAEPSTRPLSQPSTWTTPCREKPPCVPQQHASPPRAAAWQSPRYTAQSPPHPAAPLQSSPVKKSRLDLFSLLANIKHEQAQESRPKKRKEPDNDTVDLDFLLQPPPSHDSPSNANTSRTEPPPHLPCQHPSAAPPPLSHTVLSKPLADTSVTLPHLTPMCSLPLPPPPGPLAQPPRLPFNPLPIPVPKPAPPPCPPTLAPPPTPPSLKGLIPPPANLMLTPPQLPPQVAPASDWPPLPPQLSHVPNLAAPPPVPTGPPSMPTVPPSMPPVPGFPGDSLGVGRPVKRGKFALTAGADLEDMLPDFSF